jgi:hypothetical protein
MCLLTQQPASVNFTDAFLLDVYAKNKDGLGVMYAADGKLHVYKSLPANGQDFVDFYRKHAANRDCIWHARMQTHGDIDMENCHPYRVTDDIWMAHNGILSTGNDADHTKSDTWHFIKNVLRPALTTDPNLMLDPEWIAFMGSIIGGSNKFGLLRADGESCIINQKSGVKFENSWLSNTYAWTPSRFGFQSPQANVLRSVYGSFNRIDEDYGNSWSSGYANWQQKSIDWRAQQASKAQRQVATLGLAEEEVDDDFLIQPADARQVKKYVKACHNQYARRGTAGIEQWVYDAPEKATRVLAYWYEDLDEIELLDLVRKDPDQAAAWIQDLFTSDSITPSWLG